MAGCATGDLTGLRPGANMSPMSFRSATASAALAAALLLMGGVLAGCGGNELPSRQDFVDDLSSRGDGLINDNIASCMYDGLDDDDEARDAVAEWEEGEDVPPELLDLAVACLEELPDTPGT